jgi:hypothetical protein
MASPSQSLSNRGLSQIDDRLWPFESAPHKVYLAAPLTSQLEALIFAMALQDAGFIVTSRWIKTNFAQKPSPGEWESWKAFEEKWGEMDLEDVRAADTLVILCDKPSTSGGYHVELGCFLGAGKTNIVAVGGRPNVFFWTSTVRWTLGTGGLIPWLQSQRKVGNMLEGEDA